MDPYLATFLSYAPVALIGMLLLMFPLGRKVLGFFFVVVPLAIIGMLMLSEPDLRD